MKIKICGITREEEALWLNEAGADYAGFVFFEKSKRNISIQKAQKICGILNGNIKKVAVVVSPVQNQLYELKEAGFDVIQVHGEWNEEYARHLGIPVWQAINLREKEEIKHLRNFQAEEKNLQAVLFDGGNYGSGKTFGWDKEKEGADFFEEYERFRRRLKENGIRFILAGGLHPQNVAAGIRLFSPDAVDVSSGVEADTPGFTGKDKRKIFDFIKNVRCVWR